MSLNYEHSDPNLLFFAQRHFKVTGSHFSLPCFTMACLTVLVNIADVNADFACHLNPPTMASCECVKLSPFWMLEWFLLFRLNLFLNKIL